MDLHSHFGECISQSGEESLTEKLNLILEACHSIAQANILQNQVQFCYHLLQFRKQLKEIQDVERTNPNEESYVQKYRIREQLKILADFSMQPVLTHQQMDDIGLEKSRMALIFYVVNIKCQLKRE